MNVGENIRRLRKQRNMTQKELGKKLGGISQQQIGQWENGDKKPKFETLQKIANALDTNVLVLLGQISSKLADDIASNVSMQAAFAAFFKDIYGQINIEQRNDENGKYYCYILGEGSNTYTISELTYENIFESVENLIELSVNIATKYSDSQECFSLISAIKNMQLKNLKHLTAYAEYLATQEK